MVSAHRQWHIPNCSTYALARTLRESALTRYGVDMRQDAIQDGLHKVGKLATHGWRTGISLDGLLKAWRDFPSEARGIDDHSAECSTSYELDFQFWQVSFDQACDIVRRPELGFRVAVLYEAPQPGRLRHCVAALHVAPQGRALQCINSTTLQVLCNPRQDRIGRLPQGWAEAGEAVQGAFQDLQAECAQVHLGLSDRRQSTLAVPEAGGGGPPHRARGAASPNFQPDRPAGAGRGFRPSEGWEGRGLRLPEGAEGRGYPGRAAAGGGGGGDPPRGGYPVVRGGGAPAAPAVGSDRRSLILGLLARHQGGAPLETLRIAKAVVGPDATKSTVNPTLYGLEKEGRVRRLGPEPRWTWELVRS